MGVTKNGYTKRIVSASLIVGLITVFMLYRYQSESRKTVAILGEIDTTFASELKSLSKEVIQFQGDLDSTKVEVGKLKARVDTLYGGRRK